MVCRWKSGDNFQKSVLSFHFVDAGNWTPLIRLRNKNLNSLSNLAGPPGEILCNNREKAHARLTQTK